jgi:dethiobiotin synthetase
MGNYIFLGTDTSVGKTLVMAAVARRMQSLGRRVALYKPVQSGGVRDSKGHILYTDADVLSLATGNLLSPEEIAPWRFDPEIAPFVLLEESGITISLDDVVAHFHRLQMGHDVVFVEGAGGVAIPLFGEISAVDLLKALNLRPVVVGRIGLGTINHTLLTLEYLRARGVEPLGMVLTDTAGVRDLSSEKNPGIIARLGRTRILGVIPYQGDFTAGPPSVEVLDRIGALVENLE